MNYFKLLLLLLIVLQVSCGERLVDTEWEGLLVPAKYQTKPIKVYGLMPDSAFDNKNRPLRLVVFQEELIANIPVLKKIYRPDGGLYFLLFSLFGEEQTSRSQHDLKEWSSKIELDTELGYTRYYSDSNNWLLVKRSSGQILGSCSKYLPNYEVKCHFRVQVGNYGFDYTVYKENKVLHVEISNYLRNLVDSWKI